MTDPQAQLLMVVMISLMVPAPVFSSARRRR